MKYVLVNIPCLVLCIGSVYLYGQGVQTGPGWLLFGAILVHTTFKSSK